jgi:hypothetical protein
MSLFSHALTALAREPANLLLQRHSLKVIGQASCRALASSQHALAAHPCCCGVSPGMQSLPEHAANLLLAYLVESGQLTTSHLQLFKSTATQAVFSGLAAPLVDGHLLAYLSEFQHLHTLQLVGCPNLKVRNLQAEVGFRTQSEKSCLCQVLGVAGSSPGCVQFKSCTWYPSSPGKNLQSWNSSADHQQIGCCMLRAA